MGKKLHLSLSRRERQIMDIIYRRGQATVAEVLADIDDPPSYSAIRALLRILDEDKGFLKHVKDGPRYVYKPIVPRSKARRSALSHLVKTFFDDSAEQVVAALLDLSASKLSEDELDRLSKMIDDAKREGR